MASKASEKSPNIEHQLHKTPVAVIGMASLFPKASSLPEYWDNILKKIDCVTEVPPSRWSIEDYYDPNPSAPDKSYNKRGGFLPDIDFDPTEFGLPPNILEVTDISQLLSLVVARDALDDAGYGEGREWNRQMAGVILGVVGVSMKLYVPLMSRLQYPVWEKVLRASGVSPEDTAKLIDKFKLAYVGWEENSFPGSLANVVSGRVANRFDLGATNCVIDAACATSLAATKMAIMELVEGRADMMITGGVDTDNSIGVYMSFSKTPAFSKGESVRTFDADSDGMMAGEGIGMLVLKRLADAERDGDRIYAVIRGVGSSSDGRYKSIYAPRPSGQAVALRRAYAEAGYAPSTVGLIEAHGTGTPAGDPAEFQGLREVFDENNPDRQKIALGSVKSQIAHTKGAAGAAGMIKIAMALHHKILPASINVKKPNPKLDIENSPFYVNTETRPWFRRDPATPRRAGVSAFGFGGTNFHLTLEEYQSEHAGAYRTQSGAQTVLLSAPAHADLLKTCRDTLASLQGEGSARFYNQLTYASLSAEIPLEHARVGFVADSREEAVELLQTAIDLLQKQSGDAWEHPKGIFYRKAGMDPKGKVVALFSGQGSQYLEMGRELACNFPPVRQAVSDMDALFTADGLEPLSSRIYPPPVFDQAARDRLSDVLTRTEHAQPAIGSISVGLYKLLQAAGFSPDFAAGHSFGELTALWASGVLSDQDYYFLAKARGKAMSAPDDPTFDTGTMLAVKGDALKVKEDIQAFPEITLANWNSDSQVVLAGSKAEIAKVQQFLTEKGYSVVQLPVSAAFHTPLVGHAQKPFAQAIDQAKFHKPAVRLFSNTSGKAHSDDPEEIRKVLKGHILNPVLWRDEIENIYAEGGYFFVEFGPKNVLTNLVKSILGDRPHLAVALNATPKKDSDRLFREAVVQLRVAGLALKNVDPYLMPPSSKTPRKNSLATVKLNGGLYTSPKTLAAFEQTLRDGWKVSSATPQPVQAAPAAPVASTPAQPAPVAHPAPITVAPAAPSVVSTAPVTPDAMDAMERNLAQLRQHQSEIVQLHEQYLRNEEEYGRIYAKLSELEISLVSGATPEKLENIVPVFEGLERSMARFHDHQAETLRVHAQYLQGQEEYSQNLVRLVQQQYELLRGGAALPAGLVVAKPATAVQPPTLAPTSKPAAPAAPAWSPVEKSAPVTAAQPAGNGNGNGHAVKAAPAVVETPAPQPAPKVVEAPAASTYDAGVLTRALLDVVSEKTGYPSEMLELDSDLEADLGIDSIKRVEILGALRAQFPALPQADPEAFAEVRTLGQIVEYLARRSPEAAAAVAAPVQPAPAPVALASASAVASASSVANVSTYDAETLSRALLNVVSEKTGYPVEMLEMDSDMEADLGIDSIKRVEIMGALRAQFPALPQADPEAFAEVRTLGQTVTYMIGSPARPSAGPAAAPEVSTTPAPVQSAPVAVEPASQDYIPGEVLTRALLDVVSEKTGYPVEMLELGSDLEADLGIDSIKRVEIMGALRAQFPTLPQADPEAFAEVRTLGQIIDYLVRTDSGGAPEQAAPTPEPVVDASIPRGVVHLKSLPQPDSADFNLPAGHICLVTDDGTPATGALAQELTARGMKVAVLAFPSDVVAGQSPLPQGVARFTLADLSEEELERRLAELSAAAGPVGAVIHLNPASPKSDRLFSGVAKEIIKHVFLLAKHLKEPLSLSAKSGDSGFVVVVRLDGEFGLGDSSLDFDPVSGGLFGLVKTVNLEWEAVFCRAVDISPELDTPQAVSAILAELYDPNRLVTEVGYSKQGRATLAVDAESVKEVIA